MFSTGRGDAGRDLGVVERMLRSQVRAAIFTVGLPRPSGMSRIYLYRSTRLFFPLGWVDPGLICSILTRARSIFLMMPSTVAFQMNGLGLWFQACINVSIACF